MIPRSVLDQQVPDWRKARFGGGKKAEHALYERIVDAFEIREQHIDELVEFTVDSSP